MSTLRPIGDSIIFVFEDEAKDSGFTNTTSAGIIYRSLQESTQAPRWAKVLSVGPKVETIEVGMTVLIEPLRWTEGVEFEGQKVWRTVEKEIIAIREDGES